MRTTTGFPLKLAAVTCALALAQSALAFYNPSTGRWLSRDPINEEGGHNLYSATLNNPLSFWDSSGFQAETHQCLPKKWDYGYSSLKVSFLPPLCQVVLKLYVSVGTSDDRTKRWVERLKPRWQKAMKDRWYKGWKLVGNKECCDCCPDGLRFLFDLKFAETDSDASVDADSLNARSHVTTWHLGDLRFSLRHYSGVAHELGHIFGLEDEYPGSGNPVPSDWQESLMGLTSNHTKLMLRHKQTITKGAKVDTELPCGPYTVQE